MRVYSENIIKFLSRLRQYCREIMEEEMGLQVQRTRFLFKNHYYPINLVAFENQSMIGYYQRDNYQIGINKRLMYTAKIPVLKNVLRHELAHMLIALHGDIETTPHGAAYRDLCRGYGWGEEVYLRSVDIDLQNDLIEGDLQSERVIAKIQKLLKLASSSNANEAELATIKANQLLLKHNLSSLDATTSDSDCAYVKRTIKSSKTSAKLQAVARILKSFFVEAVFSCTKGVVWIEVTGNKVNVEIAHYVAEFLDSELERLWEVIKKDNPGIRGVSHKSSFFQGVANGYLEKLKNVENDFSFEDERALVKIEGRLSEQVRLVYKRISSQSVCSTFRSDSLNLGKAAGRRLTINKGVKSSKISGLLSY